MDFFSPPHKVSLFYKSPLSLHYAVCIYRQYATVLSKEAAYLQQVQTIVMDKETLSYVKTIISEGSFQEYSFPRNQYIVLKHMALKGPNPNEPQTKYVLKKYTGINHSSIGEVVDKFVTTGILKETEIDITHGRQTMKKYELTLRGLFLSLASCDQQTGLVDFSVYKDIIEKWAEVEPILLGKYDFLAKNLPEEIAKAIIFKNAWYSSGNDDWEIEERRFFAYSQLFDNIRERIDFFEYYIMNQPQTEHKKYLEDKFGELNPRGLLDKLLTIFPKDPELNNFLKEYLEETFEKAKAEQEWAQTLEKKIEKTD
jgi:hypothetical protein